ncbi:MAG: hypothetical protein PHS82_03065, partial [Lachnospiraceae bacterium]|nr:hypothetical protein [Lachnospiraceae bacterium]
MAVSKWSWSASNGTATAAQVQAAYNALTNKGRTKAFNYTVWNDIVTKISAVRSDWGDVAWNEHYEFLPFDESKMKSGDIMTADRFNTAVGNIPLFGYAWPWEPTLGRTEILKGDRCYGKYFVWLTDGLNHWIGLTKLPFSIHNSFYLGDNASIQQKDSHPLVHTKGLALGKTLKMSNLAAHDFVVHNNLMHLDHSFVMTNMPNALAFSSTFNFFDFNTLMAGAETHIAGNQILNIGLGQKIEGLFTESLPLAHYLPATSEEIILADRFTRSIGNAIYGAHSGVVSGLTMSGTSHSANSLSLDYTGEMQTGYKFNFSLDINSGIGEYLNYISVLDSFTMTASSIKENEYQGGVAIGNTAELASADLFDLANDTGEIALLHSMEMDLLETAASETNCKIDIVVSADAGIIQTAALVADYGIGVTCETNGGAGDTVPMITNEIIESKADVDLCSANEVGMQSDYEAETVLNVMLAAATFRSLYAIRSIKVLSDALAMALNNVNMASNLMLDTSLNAIVDEMDSKYMLSQTVINHNATALLEPTSDVEMSANHKIMALYGAAVEMLSNKALSAEYSIASTIISALDELVGKNLETDLTIGDSTQAGITTITDTELNTDYQIVTAESANADTTKYRLVMTTLALTAVTTALLEPTSDVEMSANHKIMALYGAAVEMLSNKALSAEYSIA